MDFKKLGSQMANNELTEEQLHHKRLELQKFAEEQKEVKITEPG